MDYFPDLGEPGIFDELFYFGPIVFQVVSAEFFFWLTGRWIEKPRVGMRLLVTIGLILVADLLLLMACGVVFALAT
jgi:asparagine N-glycosylation enzyme membrane subunit Stt3